MQEFTMADADKALNKTEIALMARPDTAFFVTVCFSLVHKWDEEIGTAATNGFYVKYSPKFFMGLDPDERLFLVLHETLHVAFIHMARLAGRNPKKWNFAADYVINAMLIERGFKMPKGGLYDPKYAGMSAEQVYDLLPDPPPCDFEMDLEEAPEDAEAMKEHVDQILVRAKMAADMAGQDPGTIPGELARYIESLVNPRLPWHRIFAKFFTSMAKTDYTYRKPNRRFFPDHILPTLYGEALGDVAMFADTSGSVDDEEFTAYISEVYPVVTQLKPKRVLFGQFDTNIKSVDTVITASDMAKVKFHGRGGTNIAPVMDWADANKPEVMVVFSDGYFDHREAKPKCPVIWVIRNNPNFTAPYGKVIHFT